MAINKPKEQRREEIISVALNCFSTKGYNGTSVGDICRLAEITKGGLYWHFSSKEEILKAVVENLCNSQDLVWKELSKIVITKKSLYEVGLNFIRYNLDNIVKVKFYSILEFEIDKNPELKSILSISRNFVHGQLVDFSHKLLQYYNNNIVDADNLAHILELSVNSIVHRKALDVVDINVEECWKLSYELIIKGLS